MPLIAWAVAAYVAGLLAGFTPGLAAPVLLAGAVASVALLPLAARRVATPLACALLGATGALVAHDVTRRDAACLRRAASAPVWRIELGDAATPGAFVRGSAFTADGCAVPAALSVASGNAAAGAVIATTGVASATPRGLLIGDARVAAVGRGSTLAQWRARAGARIDALFGGDAPMVRALLIADQRQLAPEVRTRFAAAGLVHILSISGLHVAIIAGAILLVLEAARVPRPRARWTALAVTALYVAAIGAPAPALRSAAMLGVATASRVLERPVSPWAALAVGAAIPLVDPRTATDLGWQLSVAGFAALTAAGIWTRRHVSRDVRGWRRRLVRDLVVSTLASVVTAPVIAWTFGRISLIAPLSNLAAAPVVGLLQPTLFLALLLAPFAGPASFVASAAHPLLRAFDTVASAAASVPFAAINVAPSFAVAVCGALAAVALVVAASARAPGRPLLFATAAMTAGVWWPVAPTGNGRAELHVIDVGEGDALAFRTPRGRWMLVDAGRSWPAGDAGRATVVPYVRRLGGDVALLVLSHPHADHIGGAATIVRALHPGAIRDGALAEPSGPYRLLLAAAAETGVPWGRIRPGDSLDIDGVVVTFLAPDSAWAARLDDPNAASAVVLVRYGGVRFLLAGDADAPEEKWLLANRREALAADVLKVAHHGSSTGSTSSFLDAVRPRVALISVGAGNSYGHPSAAVVSALRARGVLTLRTDQFGSLVASTDGRRLEVRGGDGTWRVPLAHR